VRGPARARSPAPGRHLGVARDQLPDLQDGLGQHGQLDWPEWIMASTWRPERARRRGPPPPRRLRGRDGRPGRRAAWAAAFRNSTARRTSWSPARARSSEGRTEVCQFSAPDAGNLSGQRRRAGRSGGGNPVRRDGWRAPWRGRRVRGVGTGVGAWPRLSHDEQRRALLGARAVGLRVVGDLVAHARLERERAASELGVQLALDAQQDVPLRAQWSPSSPASTRPCARGWPRTARAPQATPRSPLARRSTATSP